MKINVILTVAAALITASCGNRQQPPKMKVQPLSEEKTEAGDSTVYGLACDGCTDSVLVLLPNAGGDPHTYSIIEAMSKHEIFGMPRTGDQLAVLLSPDRKSARKVIDIDEMLGSWCYQVIPTLKPRPGMSAKASKKMEASMPDSIKKKLLAPKEYGFELNSDKSAKTIGQRQSQTTDDFSPVVYPKQKFYTSWRLYNGKIILTAGNLNITGMKKVKIIDDTADIVMMRRDSLVLKFKNETKGYYRKQDSARKKDDRQEK